MGKKYFLLRSYSKLLSQTIPKSYWEKPRFSQYNLRYIIIFIFLSNIMLRVLLIRKLKPKK